MAISAIEALTHHQRQLDADGVEVGVSRQALDEVLSIVDELVTVLDATLPVLEAVHRIMTPQAAAMGMGGEGPLLERVRSALSKAKAEA